VLSPAINTLVQRPFLKRKPTAPDKRETEIRKDIQGMRAIAVLIVIAYHANISFIPGGFIGVDIFFVLSGFLITGALLREIQRDGRINLGNFWARRVRRLLPTSIVVLIVTLIVSMRVLPLLQRASVSADVMWASLFSANWRFAIQQTDYLAADRVDSPVLHYWSLGVEEQFYVVWPILILLCMLMVRTVVRQINVRKLWAGQQSIESTEILNLILTLVLSILTATSFLICFRLSTSDQPFAYFGTFSRAWQLAVGGLLAIWAQALKRISSRTQSMLGVTGSGAICYSMFFIHESQVGVTPYPGWLAVSPTIGAVAIVAAGCASGRTPLQNFLSLKPLQFLGGISYSWYLVHWPFLVLGHVILQHNSLSINLYLVAASLLTAWFLSVLVENPLRFSKLLTVSSIRTLGLGALSLVVVIALGVTSIWQTNSAYASTALVRDADGQFLRLKPSPGEASSDYFSLVDVGCSLDFNETEINECTFGQVDSKKSVVILGDSHAEAIFPVVESAANKQGWKLNVWVKRACPIADVTKWDSARKRIFFECDQFREAIMQRTIESHPDVVILVSAFNPKTILINRTNGKPVTQARMRGVMVQGLRANIKRLTNSGIEVVLLHEPPFAPFDVPECLIKTKRIAGCSFNAPQQSPELQASARITKAKVLDLYSAICPSNKCSPVKKDILVYRDRTHMTKTYVMTLESTFIRLLNLY
jgi:peptidoglycan/LPS O-acetylase OafA/YrhL